MKKIGIDLDETIAATFEASLEFAKKHRSDMHHLEFDSLVHHDWWKIPNCPLSREEAIEHWMSFNLANPTDEGIHPVAWSMEVIRRLKDSGYKLFAITWRDERCTREPTFAWLQRHFPNVFESVTFTNHLTENIRKNKSDICKELDISIMIEDNLDFALELAQNWIRSFVLEKPWNRHRIETHDLITRVKGWEEISI